MPKRSYRLATDSPEIQAAFAELRRQLKVSLQFPAEVLAEAEQAAHQPRLPAADETAIPFVTLDPASSMDLDQAFHIERRGDGYRVRYAIADVAAFVQPGGPMDVEAHERGETLYAPDENARLYPPVLSEGAASLLPDQTRPAVVWTMDVDETGEGIEKQVRHALVRSRAKLDYVTAQQELDGGTADEQLRLLREIGILRQQREARRGGVSLALPEQVITEEHDGYGLRFRAPLPVEGWNAQVSLMTGMAAAELMLEGNVGLLRTVPVPDAERLERVRLTAKALHVEWPDDVPYDAFVRSLSPFIARQAALLVEAGGLLRGSGYTWFEEDPPEDPVHSALASTYAHTTAPLRRLVDRYVGEACIALSEGREIPEWVREELPKLPEVMARSAARAGQYEAGIVSIVEAALLAPRIGDTFEAIVVELHRRRGGATVAIRQPAVTARCRGDDLPLGGRVLVRLEEADVMQRLVRFEAVSG
ncbi:MAG TPA: RNB domain-containing ribonuclease [Gaiella sp.]|nr:RNB domain-containing ribonuclease [Gaiella sp.]